MGCAPSSNRSTGAQETPSGNCLCSGCYPYLCCGGPLGGEQTTTYGNESTPVPLPDGESTEERRAILKTEQMDRIFVVCLFQSLYEYKCAHCCIDIARVPKLRFFHLSFFVKTAVVTSAGFLLFLSYLVFAGDKCLRPVPCATMARRASTLDCCNPRSCGCWVNAVNYFAIQ